MKKLLWRLLARIVCTELVFNLIVAHALKHPYTHIGPAGDLYMLRFFVFNGYTEGKRRGPIPVLPTIRMHIILRPDAAGSLHNHPMDAVSVIMDSGYGEVREANDGGLMHHIRRKGDVVTIKHRDFHRITHIFPEGPAYTLFFIWPKSDGWGFKVEDKIIDRKDFHGAR